MSTVLRELTPAEIEMVAGGGEWTDDNSNGYFDDGDTIVVTGHLFTSSYGGGGGGGGGGPGGFPQDDAASITVSVGEGSTLPAEEPNVTSCVETTFGTANVSLTDVNRAALAAANAIASLSSSSYEYSSIVFVYNGHVGFTAPYTDNSYDSVNLLGGLGDVPTGSVILGIVHNHPDSVMDDRYPSSADWDGYEQILDLSSSAGLPRGITADSKMLLYVHTDQDDKTRVYDNTDKNQQSASCSLQ